MNQNTAHTQQSYTLSAVFAFSTMVIGPKINDEGNGSTATPGSSSPPASRHEAHHE